MKVIQLIVNGFQENTYIVYDTSTLKCAIIDPGVSDTQEREAITDTIEKYHLIPVHLINTHMHVDHVLGDIFLSRKYSLPISAHADDAFLASRAAEQARMFGMTEDGSSLSDIAITDYLEDGDKIQIGEEYLQVLAVPGHSPGSIALYSPQSHFVITGDALFAGSIGRTDLPGGDYRTLIDSIQHKLLTLPADTVVYPGHGPATTIEKERRDNPFLRMV